MPTINSKTLTAFSQQIFEAAGVGAAVAAAVAESLVLSNLKGHDSHGAIRVLDYVDWLGRGWIDPQAKLEVVKDNGAILAVDGHWGFGQVIGREATELALAKVEQHGVCVLTIRRCGHLGRIGEWMEMAAAAGVVCFSCTNTHGGGVLVAPHGGRERRLSANPLGAAAPLPGGGMMVMDIATSTIADGKVRVAHEKGEPLPPGCIVDARGEPSTDAADYYADPPGALLPFAGHKGYALSMFAEVLAGALSDGECSQPGVRRVANCFMAVFLSPAALCGEESYAANLSGLVRWVKSSAPMKGHDSVFLPGEPETRQQEQRLRDGVPIADATWQKLADLAHRLNVEVPKS